MKNFIKVSEAPQTKLKLRKAIENGQIAVFENDDNKDNVFRKLEDVDNILRLWQGFNYAPKYQGDANDAIAYLGTSFNYKFSFVRK